VVANRGANGIDGTVSTAFGIAAATDGPVVLLIGDVALAHDLGGLLCARRLGLQLTIVLLNNDGGGIFHFLPVSGLGDAFEHHIATPHGLPFAHAAALFGLEHVIARTAEELRSALPGGNGAGGPGAGGAGADGAGAGGGGPARLIEVRTDRAENLALHRRLAEIGLAALRS
jgi:2-succinyl-5-enolpyruvyl-6-hydroxy-3-cyclohexene-1-carboxylate synthase